MLGAHVSYWTSSSFATFVLLQQFVDYTEKNNTPSIVPEMHLDNLMTPQDQKGNADDDANDKGEASSNEEDGMKGKPDESRGSNMHPSFVRSLSPSGIL